MHLVLIPVAPGARVRSPLLDQVLFSQRGLLLRKLQRHQAEWEDAVSSFLIQRDNLLMGHAQAYLARELDLALTIERRSLRMGLHAYHRDLISKSLATLCAQRIAELVVDTPLRAGFISLHDRHSPEPYLSIVRKQALIMARNTGTYSPEMEQMTLEEILTCVDQAVEALKTAFRSTWDKADDEEEARLEGLEIDQETFDRPAPKSDAASMREDSTSVQRLRALYRKLVRAIHPDRESDPSLREKKTELMQAINAAYRAGDMLALLDLQIESGLLAVNDIDAMDEEFVQDLLGNMGRQIESLRKGIRLLRAKVKDATKDLCPPPPRFTIEDLPDVLEEIQDSLDDDLDDLDMMREIAKQAGVDELVGQLFAMTCDD